MSRHIFFLTAGAVIALMAVSRAEPPQPPKPVPEAPAMGGEPATKPGPKPIALRANEVALSRLADATLIRMTKEQLGQLSTVLFSNSRNETAAVPHGIGTIKSVLLDPARHNVTFVGVSAGANGAIVALPWSQIEAIHQPNDQFVTTLPPQTIARAPPFDQKKVGGAIEVEQALIGRKVMAADGKTVGTISDIVVETKSGTADFAVVDPGGITLGTDNASRAVPWSKLRRLTADKSRPVALTLDEHQFDAAPVFGGSKAQETKGSRAVSGKAGATEQPPP